MATEPTAPMTVLPMYQLRASDSSAATRVAAVTINCAP